MLFIWEMNEWELKIPLLSTAESALLICHNLPNVSKQLSLNSVRLYIGIACIYDLLHHHQFVLHVENGGQFLSSASVLLYLL